MVISLARGEVLVDVVLRCLGVAVYMPNFVALQASLLVFESLEFRPLSETLKEQHLAGILHVPLLLAHQAPRCLVALKFVQIALVLHMPDLPAVKARNARALVRVVWAHAKGADLLEGHGAVSGDVALLLAAETGFVEVRQVVPEV